MPVGIGGEITWICPSLDNVGNGTTTAFDQTGNNYDGTFVSLPTTAWTPDTNNGGVRCIALDGFGYLSLGNPAALGLDRTNPFSISAWVKLPSGAISFFPLISKLPTSSPYTGWEVPFNDGSGRTSIYLINTWAVNGINTGTAHADFNPAGAWCHFCVTYDGSSNASGINFYWNGILRTKFSALNNFTASMTNALSVLIGSRDGTQQSPFSFDDLRIVNRAILSNEITHLASSRAVLGAAPPPSGINPAILFHRQQMANTI